MYFYNIFIYIFCFYNYSKIYNFVSNLKSGNKNGIFCRIHGFDFFLNYYYNNNFFFEKKTSRLREGMKGRLVKVYSRRINCEKIIIFKIY